MTPTVTAGTTTTVDPETPASVTQTGTAENVILNFSIPRGVTGAQGPQGEPGADATITPAAAVAPVTDPTSATTQEVATTLNELITSLQNAGYLGT